MKNILETTPEITPTTELRQGAIVTMKGRAYNIDEPFIVARTSDEPEYILISLRDGNRWTNVPKRLAELEHEIARILPAGNRVTITIL
mgnify:CR=1 FL=1